MDVLFDDASHTYLRDGRIVPSVTQVVKQLVDWSCVRDEDLEYARQRGTLVHRLCELDDVNQLDPLSVDPALAGYLDAWRRFRSETQFAVIDIERRIDHPQWQYAGTLDRTGVTTVESGVMTPTPPGTVDLLDIKTVAVLGPEIGPQLAMYKAAHNAGAFLPIGRSFAVKLKDDGRYTVRPYEAASDWAVALACLTIFNWRGNHGKRQYGKRQYDYEERQRTRA